MTTRPFWLGTSWKMTKTLAEARAYADELRAGSLGTPGPPAGLRLFVLPPATALAATAERLGPESGVLVGAQNAYPGPEGAVTGEVSTGLVRDAGARLVEIGHAERRTLLGETDTMVTAKVASALDAGLIPLVCVGETAAERDRGETEAVLVRQVRAAAAGFSGVTGEPELLVAYEPHWAIGAAGRPALPEEVAPGVAVIRAELDALAPTTPAVLYGGSVDPDNAAELVTRLDIDGLFVGRAAWTAAGLLDLAQRCTGALAERIQTQEPATQRLDR